MFQLFFLFLFVSLGLGPDWRVSWLFFTLPAAVWPYVVHVGRLCSHFCIWPVSWGVTWPGGRTWGAPMCSVSSGNSEPVDQHSTEEAAPASMRSGLWGRTVSS